LLQGEIRHQQQEIEELREVRKQLAEREAELMRLRRLLESSERTRRDDAAEIGSGRHRRSADVLDILRTGSGARGDAKVPLLQFQKEHTSEKWARSVDADPRDAPRPCGLDTDKRGGLLRMAPGGENGEERGVPGFNRKDPFAHYLRYLALPEVRPYSGEDATYGFSTFLENFMLKYPRGSWEEAELGILFRTKLTGKAKRQYEALPVGVREGSFDGLVAAMQEACRVELRSHRIVALSELKKLRKKEGQTVADFCVELERLTRRAHPHMDEVALDAERAQLLYEQLAHWGDSYHLMEALESEAHAYDRLKQTALRIERRDWTLRHSGGAVEPGTRTGREKSRFKKEEPVAEPRGSTDTREEQSRPAAAKKRGPVCYQCHEAGHFARECSAKGLRSREASSLSARLLQPACRMVGMREARGAPQEMLPCPLIGPKHTTTVEVFGRKWTGLLDTGSEISILPAAVLLKAKEDGYDIDREVVEHRMDRSVRVCDASGRRMGFVTVVEVKLREGRETVREAVASMYVTRAMDDFIILGTNVLPTLGYELIRKELGTHAMEWKEDSVEDRTACDASVPREYSGMLESRDRENQSGPGVNPLWGCG
uniref:CCHC-type domain-containing protein n=1 Tax=Heligmosomoides polygyrus TaxID=6339 RepID=A0A183GV61_HELPZ